MPLGLSLPVQSPLAVQEVTLFVVVQVSVAMLPGVIGAFGEMFRVTRGIPRGGSVTVILVLICCEPPEFVQLKLYVYVPVLENAAVLKLPPEVD